MEKTCLKMVILVLVMALTMGGSACRAALGTKPLLTPGIWSRDTPRKVSFGFPANSVPARRGAADRS